MLFTTSKSLFSMVIRPIAAITMTVLFTTTTFAVPTTWTLQNVIFDSGDTASGSFTYDPEPYNPSFGQYGVYSDINVTVTRDGVSFLLNQVNPASRGNASYVSIVEANTSGDLTGAVFMAITPEGSMSDAGGTFDILPGPAELSYTGICRLANCGPADAPYKEIVSGQITADPLTVRWHLEGARANDGTPITGSFAYAASSQSYSGASVTAGSVGPLRESLQSAESQNSFVVLPDLLFGNNYIGVDAIKIAFATPLVGVSNTVALQTGAAAAPFLTCTAADCAATQTTGFFVASGRVARHLDPPIMNHPVNINVNENTAFVFNVNATDSIDAEGSGLTYSLVNSDDAARFALSSTTGELVFATTPNFEAPNDTNTDNTYRVTVRVTDFGGLTDNHTFDVTVDDVLENSAPVLDAIGNLTLTEGIPFEKTISAQDPDGDNLHFALANAPTGATLIDNGDDTATFRFTPSFQQSANFANVLFIVSDAGAPMLSHTEAINISVGDVNRPPRIEAVADIAAPENTPVSFMIAVSDPDGDTTVMNYGNVPTGATFTPVAGGAQFDWTPDYGQSGNYAVTVEANDMGIPFGIASHTVMITIGDVNRPPVLSPIGNRVIEEGALLSIDLVASDVDGQALNYALSNAPTGLTLVDNGDGTGNLVWTPDFSQAGSFADVMITVSDNGTPMQSDQEAFSLTVGDVNRAPVLNAPGARTVTEGEPITIVLAASDPDGDSLSYALPADLPPGASFVDNGNGSAVFNWTPAFDQAGNFSVTFRADDDSAVSASDTQVVSITVGDTNRPPVLGNIGNRTVQEGAPLAITLVATDPDGDTLAFALANAPAGATLTDNGDGSATFNWLPGFDQAGNVDDVLITVTDNAMTAQSDSEAFLISVGNVNRPPLLAAIGNRMVNEGDALTFDVTATDPDGDVLNFLAPANLPFGAQFVSNANGTATFSWTPDFSQAGNATVVFQVNDSSAASQTVSESITITVGNVNRPPQLMPIGNRAATEGTTLTLTLTAADPDGDALSFPSPAALPDGATLVDNSDGTAVFDWTPTAAQVGTVTLDFATTDGSETANESVVLTVAALPVAPPAPPATVAPASGGGGGATGFGELLLIAMVALGLRRRSVKAVAA